MKKLCLFLVGILLLTTPIQANASTNYSDDMVIAIVDGIEIRESDVDENGIIKDGVLPDSDSSFVNPNARYSTPPTMEIPYGANSLVIKTTSVPQFYQQTDYYYLNKSEASTFAYKLTGSGTSIGELVNYTIGALIGWKVTNPWFGLGYSGAFMLNSIRLNAVRDKILSYNGPVEVRVIKSNHTPTTIYAVNSWNGKTVNISQGGDTYLKFVKHNY